MILKRKLYMSLCSSSKLHLPVYHLSSLGVRYGVCRHGNINPLSSLASLMHYTLILSPKGQYLLKLVDNANKLVPYLVLKQTLKIGNVASMLQAMVKVGLAKMSVASVTNWMGLTQTQDEGMNLMQTQVYLPLLKSVHRLTSFLALSLRS